MFLSHLQCFLVSNFDRFACACVCQTAPCTTVHTSFQQWRSGVQLFPTPSSLSQVGGDEDHAPLLQREFFNSGSRKVRRPRTQVEEAELEMCLKQKKKQKTKLLCRTRLIWSNSPPEGRSGKGGCSPPLEKRGTWEI